MKKSNDAIYSAWFNGTWERMIKTIKNCLYKVISRGRIKLFPSTEIKFQMCRKI